MFLKFEYFLLGNTKGIHRRRIFFLGIVTILCREIQRKVGRGGKVLNLVIPLWENTKESQPDAFFWKWIHFPFGGIQRKVRQLRFFKV